MCAAIAAARHGTKVVLMQDRPMVGGNASSEVRMWVCGALGSNNRETGIIEEILLENQYRNPHKNYCIWDTILYEKVRFEPNITLLLNCSCLDAAMEDNKIVSVTGWQMTTQTFHHVKATLFADCSGDSILAPLTGAEYRVGREGRQEYGESIAPLKPDRKTMGMSCLIQAEEGERASVFIPPVWAEKYTKDDLPYRLPDLNSNLENFWYIELGGERDTISDTEKIRDELYAVAFGIWDYLKNDPDQRDKNLCWRLSWMGMLPGKRESRRYVGDYILTQHDVESKGEFDDLVAYGGWMMDDHHPYGFRTGERPTIYHPVTSPYGIPYRCLYSKNISNLMFAGRNISTTHSALSSTRVMATCALLGQAVGTAASIAIAAGTLPRGVYEHHLKELRETLMDDDCWLLFTRRPISALSSLAKRSGDAPCVEKLFNGYERRNGTDDNAWTVQKGGRVRFAFKKPEHITGIRIIFDSDLDRATLPEPEMQLKRPMIHNRPLDWPDSYVPKTLVKSYRIEAVFPDGVTVTIVEVNDNHQRLCRHQADIHASEVIITFLDTWGYEECRVFAVDIL